MKKVFVKLSGVVLATSLLCSTIPASAVWWPWGTETFNQATQTEGAESVRSGIAQFIMGNAGRLLSLANNHRIATAAAAALALASTYYAIKCWTRPLADHEIAARLVKAAKADRANLVKLSKKNKGFQLTKEATTLNLAVSKIAIDLRKQAALHELRDRFVAEYVTVREQLANNEKTSARKLNAIIAQIEKLAQAPVKEKTVVGAKKAVAPKGKQPAVATTKPKAVATTNK